MNRLAHCRAWSLLAASLLPMYRPVFAADTPPPVVSEPVRVPYIPEAIRDQIRDDVKREVLAQAKRERWGEPGALPEWIQRIKFDGDIRFRNEQIFYQKDNAPIPNIIETNRTGNATLGSNVNRRRWRLRTRIGIDANVTDGVNANFRFATGSTSDPVSTNQTLGDNNNHNSFVVDRAYLRLDPYRWLTLAAGKIPNPWMSTDLVWDEDLNFDGVALTLKPTFGERWTGFFGIGAFPQQELAAYSQDKFLYGAQIGMGWGTHTGTSVKVAAAYYQFRNVLGQRNPPGSHEFDYTAPSFVQRGNSLFNIAQDGSQLRYALASQYKELDVVAVADIANFSPTHVIFTADYVKNLAFDRQAAEERGAVDPFGAYGNNGYLGRVTVGAPDMRKRGDWQVSGAYKHLESDAVLDAFTDSDFHLGGTNAKGWILGYSYGVAKNTWLGVRYLTADEISGPPLAIDVWQIDINARF